MYNAYIYYNKLYFFSKSDRVRVNEKEVKVNIFDMAGHPIFYEVNLCITQFIFKAVCIKFLIRMTAF